MIVWVGAIAAAMLEAFQHERQGWDEGYLEIARQAHARRPGLPSPTELFDWGLNAAVFESTDPDVLIRVTHRDTLGNELLLLDEDFKGGVARLFGVVHLGDFVITWKERVSTNVQGFLVARGEPETARALLGLYDGLSEPQLETLKASEYTRGLAEAIELGLPTADIDLSLNLGVTRDGRVVAYDP